MTPTEALQTPDPLRVAVAFQLGKDGGLTWDEALDQVRAISPADVMEQSFEEG